MTTYTVTYSSNNSGGDWWLKDEHWKALEARGWTVRWFADMAPRMIMKPDETGRWLGALASEASIDVEAESEEEAEAIATMRWRIITGQDPDEPGCSCCGQPHYLYAKEKE